jgi:hypothetical protein
MEIKGIRRLQTRKRGDRDVREKYEVAEGRHCAVSSPQERERR